MIINKYVFFEEYRKEFGNIKTNEQVQDIEFFIDYLVEAVNNGEISEPIISKMAYILATAYWEPDRPFNYRDEENLNYSTVDRLMKVWPMRFPKASYAQSYLHNPQVLANFVYNGRYGNRFNSNDGWLYRGRGLMQITFKEVYERFGRVLGIDLVNNPELANDPHVAAKIIIMGMVKGMFTGKKLGDYIKPGYKDFTNARAIINNDVKANGYKIAKIAQQFVNILSKSVV